jgi:cell division protease FtsH
MNQRWRLLALWLLPVAVALFLGWQVLGPGANRNATTDPVVAPRNTAVARMSYGRFLDYVQAGRVTAVDIYEGGRTAVIEAVDPDLDNRVQRLRVDLPGLAPELVNKLKDQGISFDIHPAKPASPAIGLLGNLLFPLLLIGSLVFLARRSNGMPGGPGQAMQFGKTKARFAMEAETGVKFDDVAGVEEAKQDLRRL